MTDTNSCSMLRVTFGFFLAVQNSSIGDLVNHWVSHWLRTLLLDIQRATPETCDIWDIWYLSDEETWSDQHFDLITILIFFDFFWPCCQYCQILVNFDYFDILDKNQYKDLTFETLITILTIETWIHKNLLYLTINCDIIRNSCNV